MTSREERLSDLVNKAGGPTSYAYLRGAKLTRVANASEKKRMSDVVRLMQRQLGEAMIVSYHYPSPSSPDHSCKR